MAQAQTARLLEAAEIAKEAGVTPATIRYDIDAGRLTPAAVTGRGRLFDRAEVDRYLEDRRSRTKARYGKAGAE